MQEKACCFTSHIEFVGHVNNRKINWGTSYYLKKALQNGYTRFICSFVSATDVLFATKVLKSKKDYPGINLEAILVTENTRLRLMRSKTIGWLLNECSNISVCTKRYERESHDHCAQMILSESSRVIAVYDGREEGRDHTSKIIRLADELEIQTKIISTK
ncbi:MAG: hypothetical protein LIO58_02375 [Oscillospiraceae bacterium]|nr:hypothetical protein [Oscillospiraceae bacterium]